MAPPCPLPARRRAPCTPASPLSAFLLIVAQLSLSLPLRATTDSLPGQVSRVVDYDFPLFLQGEKVAPDFPCLRVRSPATCGAIPLFFFFLWVPVLISPWQVRFLQGFPVPFFALPHPNRDRPPLPSLFKEFSSALLRTPGQLSPLAARR